MSDPVSNYRALMKESKHTCTETYGNFKKKLKVPMCMLHIHSGLCMKQLYKNDHKISQGTKGFRGVALQKHVYASCEIA